MRLSRFRVQHYRSITDSGWCWLASDVTILAGKNESGKTAMLEALGSFDTEEEVLQASIPVQTDERPLLEATFSLDDDDVADLADDLSSFMPQEAIELLLAGDELYLRKNFNDEYTLPGDVQALLDASSTDNPETASDDYDIDSVITTLRGYLPRFVFFSSFEDILPFEIEIATAVSQPVVADLLEVAGLDLDALRAADSTQKRKNLLRKCSAVVSGDFASHWQQDALELTLDTDGVNLLIGIKEVHGTDLFAVEQRSKGLQWFLSFYLRLNARSENNSVLLIDEPGLYLHATAQKDVLRVLTALSKDTQVLFSTHSPYLLDPGRLDRVRLVLKEPEIGTRIENKVHKGADAETLTPIHTAIGLDVSTEFSVVHDRNAVLEGIADYYYLRAMSYFVAGNLTKTVHLIPCVGVTNIPQIVSILIGWDLKYVAVLDRDNAGKGVRARLAKKLSVPEVKIVFVSSDDGACIEDLFTPAEFAREVLHDVQESIGYSNSKLAKLEKYDEILLAQQFFQRVRDDKSSVKLSAATVTRFRDLFRNIAAGIDAPPTL